MPHVLHTLPEACNASPSCVVQLLEHDAVLWLGCQLFTIGAPRPLTCVAEQTIDRLLTLAIVAHLDAVNGCVQVRPVELAVLQGCSVCSIVTEMQKDKQATAA